MSEKRKRHTPLKALFGSFSRLPVKHPKAKPGAYYKQNQKQCMKHTVARLNERLPHWDADTLEQLVLVDMVLESLAQREYRFSFMQEASTRTRKYAPFAPRNQDDIQVWKREFHKAGRDYQRIAWTRSRILRESKIPTPGFWRYESLYEGLKSSDYLSEKCIERGMLRSKD
ncbi:hypothetical protein BJX96DRAFT_172430 [Aspergillus floccosus]